MKASDLTSSSSEREEESRSLLHTERTDAVNTGIVDSADRTSRTPARKVSKAGRADKLTGHRPRKGGAGPDVDASTDDAASEGPSSHSGNLKGKAAKGAKGLAAKAARKAVKGTELEGTDDVVYGAYAAYRGGRWMRNRLADRKAKKNGEASASEGKRKLSLQGRADEVATATDGTHGTQRGSDGGKAARSAKTESRKQMSRYYKREVYTTAEKAAAKKASKPLAQRLLASSKEGGGGAAASAAGGCLPVVIVALLLLFVIVGLVGAIGGDNESSSSLTTTEQQVASYLMSQGLDELHTAAIMGNMYAESGMDPAAQESGGTGIGICQWSYSRASNLRSYAASQGKSWTDLSVQLDFFWNEDIWASEWSSTYVITRHVYDGDPAVGETVSGSKSGFLETDDLEEAVKQFCYGWERPGIPRLSVRLEAAQRYYTALTTGSYTGGEDYANAESWQKAIVQAAYNTPSTGSGYCAAWVSNVYQNAGLGYVGGNACCMYLNYCTSSDTDDLKVGMLVAVQQTTSSHGIYNNGHLGYGHVGIYIGDGMVISNRGSIVVETLEEFAASAYTGCTVKWGWPSGVPSS